MELILNELLPTYFPESAKQHSEVWGSNLTIAKGDLIKIVAPSGSGKTSLMHFLFGLRSDYAGSIRYNNHQLSGFSVEELSGLRKDKVSIVLQDLRLLPEQTVYQNLYIKHQLQPFHQVERIKQMAERLGIGSKLNNLAKTCSYGEQQRIAIIRALLQPFEILLLDEPFSHLDNSNSEKAMELILEEAGLRKAAIVFADLERIDFFPYKRLYHL